MRKHNLLYSVEDLLPHTGRIILITDVVEWGDDWLIATVDHSQPSLFKREDGTIPAWVGIEYMAQTIGALIGIRDKQNNQPVRIGFLMGTNKYKSSTPYFAKDSILTVHVKEIYSNKVDLASFDCKIEYGDGVASAQIKAIRPENPEEILGEVF